MLTKLQLQHNINDSNLDEKTKKQLHDMLSMVYDNRSDVRIYVEHHIYIDNMILDLMPIGVAVFVNDIVTQTDLSNQKITSHLHKLVNRGIVKREVVGKRIVNVETYNGIKEIESDVVIFTRLK